MLVLHVAEWGLSEALVALLEDGLDRLPQLRVHAEVKDGLGELEMVEEEDEDSDPKGEDGGAALLHLRSLQPDPSWRRCRGRIAESRQGRVSHHLKHCSGAGY